MRTVAEINREIEELKALRKNVKGTTTEVYTRIVGYYRSVRNWNKGKREEFNHRITFSNYNDREVSAIPEASYTEETNVQGDLFAPSTVQTPASYLYFYRQTCPNCPSVKAYMSELPIEGIEIDVDSDEGLSKAREMEILASPTVIMLDSKGSEIFRSSRVEELKETVPGLISGKVSAGIPLEV